MVSLPDKDLSRAVLIGTSEFERLPKLPAVRNNLSDLHAALTHPQHGILTPANCEVVANPDSPAMFMNRLEQVANRTNDFLLVYYAGHGVRHQTRDELYLTVPGTDSDALYGTAVEFRWVREVLEHSPARACLLVLDCCYSGMALGTMSAPDTRDIEVRGSAVLASSPKNRKSHSPVGHKHTAFTGKVIDLLQNGSPVAGEPLTVHTLYKRVSVALVSEQFPKPTLRAIDTSGDLLVRRFEMPPVPAVRQPVSPPPPVADAPTMRTLPPFQRPRAVPQPPPADPAAPSAWRAPPGPSAASLAKVGLLAVLGVLTAICLPITLGGLLGVLFGSADQESARGDDVGYLVGGAVMLAVVGTPLLLLRRRWSLDRRACDPPYLTRFVWSRVALLLGIPFFVALAVTYMLDRKPASTAGSEVMNRSSLMIVMIELACWCGYLLFRWWRHKERPAPTLSAGLAWLRLRPPRAR